MLNFRLYSARWFKYLRRRQAQRVGVLRPTLECLEDRYVPSTFTVSDTLSLRQAIIDSNTHPGANGPNTIDFGPSAGLLIQPVSALPVITSPVVINGAIDNGLFQTVLNGDHAAGSPNGLTIAANGCTIENLDILGFGTGIVIEGNDNTIGGTTAFPAEWTNEISTNRYSGITIVNGSGNKIEGDEIGIDLASSNSGNGNDGVKIEGDLAMNNVIGGTAAGAGNQIIGNGKDGVGIIDGASENYVEGNSIGIGTTVYGIQSDGNQGDGVYIGSGANHNFIGNVMPTGEGKPAAGGNVITGNSKYGVEINGADTDLNFVSGNDIGTVKGGGLTIGNQLNGTGNELGGVLIHGGASDNFVGGVAPVAGNVISGNTGDGVVISGKGTTENFVAENHIGTNLSGMVALPNGGAGVFIEARATGNTIGLPGGSQFISGNADEGVLISDLGTTGNMIEGNQIGTATLPNGFSGVAIDDGATGNTVGGTSAAAGNTITGNKGDGVNIAGAGTDNNTVEGNSITGNDVEGVLIQQGAAKNTVGTASAPNVLSGNTDNGVALSDADTKGNKVDYNFIGLNAAGDNTLANGANGVLITQGASANSVANNFIAGNDSVGVRIEGAGTEGNSIDGNSIGVAEDGSAYGNLYGVFIEAGASANTIAGNTIANNTHAGVGITGKASIDNKITQNSIFANGGLGIDLGNTGVPTTNTSTGPNVGPNQLQNYPVLTGITADGSMLTVTGTLQSTPGSTFIIEFFDSPTGTPGQGKNYLGYVSMPSATGDIFFTFSFTPSVVNPYLTATATDINGNTSEFSVPLHVPLISTNGNGLPVGSTKNGNANVDSVFAALAAEFDVEAILIIPATANSYQGTIANLDLTGESAIVDGKDVSAADVVFTDMNLQTPTGKIFETLA